MQIHVFDPIRLLTQQMNATHFGLCKRTHNTISVYSKQSRFSKINFYKINSTNMRAHNNWRKVKKKMQFHLCEFVTLYHLVASSVFSHFYFSINWTMGNTHYTHWYHCCWCCCYTCNFFFHSWWFFDNVPRDRITAQHISVNYYEKEIFSTDTNNWCGTDLLIPLIIVSFSVCSLSNCQHLIHAHICQSITRSLSISPFISDL